MTGDGVIANQPEFVSEMIREEVDVDVRRTVRVVDGNIEEEIDTELDVEDAEGVLRQDVSGPADTANSAPTLCPSVADALCASVRKS